ncbi:MAG TPA: hypothetical protein VFG79_02450 [Solirubrobacter sp.]|nr:hypothetical protein [Solirubrobacter sp.]
MTGGAARNRTTCRSASGAAARACERSGNRRLVGTIDEIYLDAETDGPGWAVVSTGLFGNQQSIVPIGDATSTGDGVRVPFEKAVVKDAPRIDPDGRLSQDEERALYQHYGREYRDFSGSADSARGRPRAAEEVRRRGRGHEDRAGAPRGGSPRARADHRRQRNDRCKPFIWTKTADEILPPAPPVKQLQTRDASSVCHRWPREGSPA